MEGSGGLLTVKSVISNDDGATWGSRSQVYVPTGSNNNGMQNLFSSRSNASLTLLFLQPVRLMLHRRQMGRL